jgi:hypothetical protein
MKSRALVPLCSKSGVRQDRPALAFVVIFAVGVGIVATGARAHGLPDQVSFPPTLTTVSCGGDPSGPMYQSFTPTRRLLASVDLPMRAGGSFPSSGANTTIRIRRLVAGGNVVATTTTHVPGPVPVGGSVTLHADFVPPAALDPEGAYVIEGPALHPAVLTWFARDDNPYAAGTMFGCTTQESPGWDLNFATYVPPDTQPPETTIGRGPAEGAFARISSFVFGGSDDLTYPGQLRFECSLDDAGFAACPSTTEFSLGDGPHRVAVRAVDQTGKVDATPTTRSWMLDTTPPTRPRVRGPRRTAMRAVTFQFVSSDAGTPTAQIAFLCSVDSSRLRSCRSTFRARLRVGVHLLRVAAVDPAGNRSGVTLTRIKVTS